MSLTELETKYTAKLESIASEKRSFTEADVKELDAIKAEMKALKDAELLAATIAEKKTEMRSIVEAQQTIKSKLETCDKNTFYRSITTGAVDTGNREVVDDIVRQYVSQSPIYAAHQNVQARSTGNSFAYTKIVGGGTGYVKTEGNAGTEDSTTSASLGSVTFKTYSGQKIIVTQEALDDFKADIAQEINAVSLAQSVQAFAVDIYTALTAVTRTQTATTSWQLSDLSGAFFAMPARNAFGLKWVMNGTVAAAICALIDADATFTKDFIGLSKESIIVDSLCTSNTIYLMNPTLGLAIGRKEPVRIFVNDVSEGKTFEAQPRLAVALRDSTAVKKLERKLS